MTWYLFLPYKQGIFLIGPFPSKADAGAHWIACRLDGKDDADVPYKVISDLDAKHVRYLWNDECSEMSPEQDRG
jgi:hypothetical protein